MKIEEQVTNLKISKKLKDLGVKQNSLFYWEHQPLTSKTNEANYHIVFGKYPNYDERYHISAFTSSELGEMFITNFGITTYIALPKYRSSYNKPWVVYYDGNSYGHIPPQERYLKFSGETEVEARGLMIEYLLEEKLIKIDK
jgi:hypothetical protein